MNKKCLNLLLLVLATKCFNLEATSITECKMRNGALHRENEALEQASNEMWAKFDETCETTDRCVVNVGDEVAVTRLNYINMRHTEQYEAVKKTCSDLGTEEFPTTLCKVNSRLEVPNDQRNVQFFAKREPVCFAYQCSEKQIELVERSPLGCNPETHDCIIHSEEADCPERAEGAGGGNCKLFQKAINEDKNYTDAKDALNIAAGSYCTETEDDDDDVCEYEVQPIQITVGENFRSFENDETFLNYAEACYDAGGQTCYMSLNSRIVGQVVVFDLDVTGDYNDFPACYPSDCAHEDKEALAKETLASNMADKISDALSGFIVRRRLSGEEVEDLHEESIKEHIKRVLQTDSNGVPCPLGMTECEATVVDFFCTGRDGPEADVVEYVTLSSGTSFKVAASSILALVAITTFLVF